MPEPGEVRPRPAARAWSISRLLSEPTPADYLWASDAWWRIDAHPGINPANNKLGERFAIDAITAQPLDYLRVVGRDVLLTFVATDRPQGGADMTFTARPRIPVLPWYYRDDIRAYAGTAGNSHAVDPYAFFVFLYQQPVIFPGLLFLLVLLGGLAGVVRAWRRWGGMAALPWALAAVSVVSPALLTQSLYRYVIVAIPLACLAAGLAFADLRPRQARHSRPTAPTQPAPTQPAPTQSPLRLSPRPLSPRHGGHSGNSGHISHISHTARCRPIRLVHDRGGSGPRAAQIHHDHESARRRGGGWDGRGGVS